MFVFDDPGVSGRRGMPGVLILALVSFGAAALWWFQPEPESTSEHISATGAYSCVVAFGDERQRATAMETCRRQAEDAARRAPLPAGRPQIDPTAVRVNAAVQRAVVCPRGRGSTCGRPRPAGTADVALIQAVLRDEGFPDATVRLARPGDPAPDDSVVYAVRLPGDICVVAHAVVGNGANNNGVTGPLPNGECLATA